ncbi:hypothetical protein P167DRAFT_296681 [Morchella conica CCBAS932]|uniref:Uncharacterized protein n=1 Tax=Morchella conica CCBAS932 TaxID=1392247 RepID=A0A3N4KGH2_9PEZI|nr:hypothetical protein P167DRAFT_296681 [Morchella conica CCBAS932]
MYLRCSAVLLTQPIYQYATGADPSTSMLNVPASAQELGMYSIKGKGGNLRRPVWQGTARQRTITMNLGKTLALYTPTGGFGARSARRLNSGTHALTCALLRSTQSTYMCMDLHSGEVRAASGNSNMQYSTRDKVNATTLYEDIHVPNYLCLDVFSRILRY